MASSFVKKLRSMMRPQSSTASPQPLEGIPERVQGEMAIINNAVEHVRGCGNFPCDTCVRGMSLVKEISGNSALDQVAIGNLMAQRTNFAQMFVTTWEKQHLLDLWATTSSEKLSGRGERAFEFYRALAGTCWNYTDESEAFCRAVADEGCLRSLVDWMLVVATSEDLNKWATEIVFNVMNILHNVCRRLPDITRSYRRVVPALEKLGDAKDTITKTCAFMTLSYLVKKDEADKLSTNAACVETLLDLIKESSQNLDHKTRITRATGTDAFRRGFTLSTIELIQAVEQLSINDANKGLIAEKDGIPLLGRMLEFDCTVEEKTRAAEGLWSLAFLEENREKMRQEKEIIKELIQNARTDNHALQAACKGALFKIFDSKLPKETTKKIVEADEDGHEAPTPDVLNGATPPSTAGEDAVVDARGCATQKDEGGRPNEKDAQPHIMISYKWESPSKEVMREIKNKLKAMGYRVWMDEDFMSGDLIEAMTSAVENAHVILACISEGYQESKNCRTEATYAYDWDKKIVPIKVSNNFRATGWLGGITAGKIYYVIKDVDEVTRELPRIIDLEIGQGREKSEAKITEITDDNMNTPEQEEIVSPPAPSAVLDVTGWDQKRVREWLKENGISTRNKGLKNLNGVLVLQLKKQLATAPESFYQCMKEEFKVDYTDRLSLAAALEKL